MNSITRQSGMAKALATMLGDEAPRFTVFDDAPLRKRSAMSEASRSSQCRRAIGRWDRPWSRDQSPPVHGCVDARVRGPRSPTMSSPSTNGRRIHRSVRAGCHRPSAFRRLRRRNRAFWVLVVPIRTRDQECTTWFLNGGAHPPHGRRSKAAPRRSGLKRRTARIRDQPTLPGRGLLHGQTGVAV